MFFRKTLSHQFAALIVRNDVFSGRAKLPVQPRSIVNSTHWQNVWRDTQNLTQFHPSRTTPLCHIPEIWIVNDPNDIGISRPSESSSRSISIIKLTLCNPGQRYFIEIIDAAVVLFRWICQCYAIHFDIRSCMMLSTLSKNVNNANFQYYNCNHTIR